MSITEIFQESATGRAIEYLLTTPPLDFSKADIARRCKTSWLSADKILNKLERLGVIKKTRIINRAHLYKICPDSLVLKNFRELEAAMKKFEEVRE